MLKSSPEEVTSLVEEAGFKLRKWMRNSRDVLATIPGEERAKPNLDLDLDELHIERTLQV